MEWMCAECGAPHQKNNPPCKECGAMQFEKTVVRQKSEDDGADPANIEWECTECGRRHPKNNPPCSQCGHMQLESIEVDHSGDAEISAGFGVRDVLKAVGAVAVVGVLVLGVLNAGVLDQSPPTVENVPGDANTSSGLDLNTVELQIYENINENRSAEGLDALSLNPDTEAMADFINKRMVKRGKYPSDMSSEDVSQKFSSCESPTWSSNHLYLESRSDERRIDQHSTEEEVARILSESWLTDSGTREILLDRDPSNIGVDVHVDENGDIYATAAFC